RSRRPRTARLSSGSNTGASACGRPRPTRRTRARSRRSPSNRTAGWPLRRASSVALRRRSGSSLRPPHPDAFPRDGPARFPHAPPPRAGGTVGRGRRALGLSAERLEPVRAVLVHQPPYRPRHLLGERPDVAIAWVETWAVADRDREPTRARPA